jgi:crossover junction endodeoxyribonuclease RuvC
VSIDRCILGIDPGISGAIAFYFPGIPSRVAAEDIPVAAGEINAAGLAARIRRMRPDVAVIERVGAMPGQGVASMFKFGAAYGTVCGVLAALEIPTRRVAPVVWKKHFRLPADKEASRALALRLFPATAEHFARKKDHGRAEAALIARYGSEVLGLLSRTGPVGTLLDKIGGVA